MNESRFEGVRLEGGREIGMALNNLNSAIAYQTKVFMSEKVCMRFENCKNRFSKSPIRCWDTMYRQ